MIVYKKGVAPTRYTSGEPISPNVIADGLGRRREFVSNRLSRRAGDIDQELDNTKGGQPRWMIRVPNGPLLLLEELAHPRSTSGGGKNEVVPEAEIQRAENGRFVRSEKTGTTIFFPDSANEHDDMNPRPEQ